MSQTALVFLLLFATFNVLALTRHPIFGVIAYVGLVFIDPPSRWWGAALPELRWSLVSAIVTMIGMLVHRPAPPAVPFHKHGIVLLMVLFLAWIALQTSWALDIERHLDLLNYYSKYLIAVYLIYRCVDSEQHLRWLLWTMVAGSTYLAWVAYFGYAGGRFDEFGGAGIGEANAGALTLVAGIYIAAALFLEGHGRARWLLLLLVPFMLNSLIMTISRSGFLAFAVAGLAFNLFTPTRFRMRVAALSVLAAAVFVVLTDPGYWTRIETLKYRGQEVEGVETGTGRVETMRAQLRMFRDHPLGCGHHCTEVLSPSYLDEPWLDVRSGTRASHNTFLSMAVEHGIPGVAYYVLLYVWVFLTFRRLRRRRGEVSPFLILMTTGLAACAAAQIVADQFVPYVRYEVRYWILVVLMAMVNLSARSVTSVETVQTPRRADPAESLKPRAVGDAL